MLVSEAEICFEMKIPEIVLRNGGRGATGMSPGLLDFNYQILLNLCCPYD